MLQERGICRAVGTEGIGGGRGGGVNTAFTVHKAGVSECHTKVLRRQTVEISSYNSTSSDEQKNYYLRP